MKKLKWWIYLLTLVVFLLAIIPGPVYGENSWLDSCASWVSSVESRLSNHESRLTILEVKTEANTSNLTVLVGRVIVLENQPIPTVTPTLTPTSTPTISTAFHVSVNGNDGNAGTEAAPFATIQHAIDLLPRTLYQPASISISAGTYNEDIDMNGIVSNGYLNIVGFGEVKVGSVLIRNCSAINVKLQNIFILHDRLTTPYNYDYGLLIFNSSPVYIFQCRWGADCTNALDAEWSLVYAEENDIGIDNVQYGIVANKLSRILSKDNHGTATAHGLRAGVGGEIMKYNAVQPTGRKTNEYSNTGGLIR